MYTALSLAPFYGSTVVWLATPFEGRGPDSMQVRGRACRGVWQQAQPVATTPSLAERPQSTCMEIDSHPKTVAECSKAASGGTSFARSCQSADRRGLQGARPSVKSGRRFAEG